MNKAYTEMKNKYLLLLHSGMFFEFYPELSGEWVKDKIQWKKIIRKNKLLQQKQNIIDIMKADKEDGLYNQNKSNGE